MSHFTKKDMNKQIVYPTKGVCSQAISIELEGDVIKSVQFMGGCPGNTQGIAMLVPGMKVEEVISRLEGIIPAIESSHAVAYGMKLAKQMGKGSILINLSGRGDKDMDYIIEKYGVR